MRAAARVSCRLAILALGASPGAGHAEDLRAALAAAYAANPTLAAARETLRATDEGVAIARADGYLVISPESEGASAGSVVQVWPWP